jgi:hypothetical protein
MNNEILTFALFNIPSIVCIGFAGYLCHKDKDGWGWFLFVALMLSRVPDGVFR